MEWGFGDKPGTGGRRQSLGAKGSRQAGRQAAGSAGKGLGVMLAWVTRSLLGEWSG